MKFDLQRQSVEVFSKDINAFGPRTGSGDLTGALLKKAGVRGGGIGFKVTAGLPSVPKPPSAIPMGPEGFYRTPPPSRHRFWTEDENGKEKFNSPFTPKLLWTQIDVHLHPCGADVSLSGGALGLQLPTSGFHYRFPGECRQEPPEPKRVKPTTEIESKNRDWDKYFAGDNDLVICGISASHFSKADEPTMAFGGVVQVASATSVTIRSMDGWQGDLEKLRKYYPSSSRTSDETSPVWFFSPSNLSTDFSCNATWTRLYRTKSFSSQSSQNFTLYQNLYSIDSLDSFSSSNEIWQSGPSSLFIFIGYFKTLKAHRPSESFKRVRVLPSKAGTANYVDVLTYNVDFFVNLTKNPTANNLWQRNPPPDLINDDREKKERECCMECCNSNKDQNNDALLREILKRVKNTEARLGSNDYPFAVPKSLIKQTDNWLSGILPPETKQINNTQEFIRHVFLSLDELLGEFEIPIQIKDSDPTTPGEQPSGMKILNVAEGISELAALSIISSTNSEVAINMMSRILYELAALRQSDADGNSKTKALIEFFGFKTKDVQDSIKLTFSPGTDKLDEMLTEKEHPITITVFDDSKQTYKHDAAKLLEAAAITKAVNTKKVNLNSAALDIAKNIRELAKNKAKQDEVLSKKQEADFDKVIDDYEMGFIDTIGIDDAANPSGEPYTNRPKVKKLTPPTPPTTPPKK